MLYRKPCRESPGSKVCLEELLEYLSLSVLLWCGRCFLDALPGKEREREECPLRKDRHLHYLGVKVNGIGRSVFPSYTLYANEALYRPSIQLAEMQYLKLCHKTPESRLCLQYILRYLHPLIFHALFSKWLSCCRSRQRDT